MSPMVLTSALERTTRELQLLLLVSSMQELARRKHLVRKMEVAPRFVRADNRELRETHCVGPGSNDRVNCIYDLLSIRKRFVTAHDLFVLFRVPFTYRRAICGEMMGRCFSVHFYRCN